MLRKRQSSVEAGERRDEGGELSGVGSLFFFFQAEDGIRDVRT